MRSGVVLTSKSFLLDLRRSAQAQNPIRLSSQLPSVSQASL
jgi:hypothetical protein